MDQLGAEQLATRFLSGQLSLEHFLKELSAPKTADLGEAELDLDRARRCGFPEVVFGEGKPVETLTKIFRALIARAIDVLATRIEAGKAAELAAVFPTGRYNPLGRTFRIARSGAERADEPRGRVAIVTAGTSDLPVAEEARETALWMGADVTLIQDVGVAGPHRLPAQLPKLAGVDAVVVVAGMEGALPSVVGGYVDCPVFGVPTSVGYGASFGGIAALLSMLNSCAANVAVVNIDAGFKGGYLAGLIASKAAARRRAPD